GDAADGAPGGGQLLQQAVDVEDGDAGGGADVADGLVVLGHVVPDDGDLVGVEHDLVGQGSAGAAQRGRDADTLGEQRRGGQRGPVHGAPAQDGAQQVVVADPERDGGGVQRHRLLHLRAQAAKDEVVEAALVGDAGEGIHGGGAGHGQVVVGAGQGEVPGRAG